MNRVDILGIQTSMTTPEMKRPTVALEMADHFWGAIEDGDKTLTIREGRRDFQPGDKLVFTYSEFEEYQGGFEVTDVTQCPLKDVPIDIINAEGWSGHKQALKNLQAFYPDLTMESFVTVIQWKES